MALWFLKSKLSQEQIGNRLPSKFNDLLFSSLIPLGKGNEGRLQRSNNIKKSTETKTLNTLEQYQQIISICRSTYLKKAQDYGTSWRVYRTISIADQLYIKAWRVRQIQESGVQKIEDSI